jgi:molecular chaperone GrpE
MSNTDQGPQRPEGEQERVVVNDKRRIDPTTGTLRDPTSPFPAGAAPGDPAGASQPISATMTPSAEVQAAQQEAAERLADLQRVTAEYANYRKRTDRDRDVIVANAKAMVLTEMLTVLDDIDRAEKHGDLTGSFKAVADRLTATLKRLGLNQFGTRGDEFDPARHEAVQFTTSPDVTVQTVDAVFRHGYLLGDRLVRAAMVAVAGPGEGEGSTATTQEDDMTETNPGSSGGHGGVSPDGLGGHGDPNEQERTEVGAPKGNWRPGATTGDSGGHGGVGPDGSPRPDAE